MSDRLRRILVTADGSSDSEAAFAAVLPLLKAEAPEVTVLHVLESPEAPFTPPAQVAGVCRALRSNGVAAHLELREGKPAREIARLANRLDLVVMSTHGRSGLKRLVLGSVTEDVLRQVEVPLLVTRPEIPARPWERMVVALDGSPRGEAILQDVVPLARRMKASVTLIQSALPRVTMAGIGDVGGVQIEENPLPYLEKVRARLASEGVTATVAALEGRAGSQILRYAQESNAALLCMTTHGRSGLARIVLGSIADEVLRQAPCPVLLRRSIPAEPGPEGDPLPVLGPVALG
jgi:nucleotide-binding universal stress UspA family protein